MSENTEAGGLVERLRDTYTEWNNPPSDGLPDGAGILLQSATTIEALSAALASERAVHAETKRELADLKDEWEAEYETRLQYQTRLRGTEARLAEAMKALDGLLEPFEGDDCRYDHHGYCQSHFLQDGDECCVKIARRVREGGKVE